MKGDLVLIVDSTASEDDFASFTNDLAESIESRLPESGIRLALVQFSTDAHIVFNLNSGLSQAEMGEIIRTLKPISNLF